VERDLPAGFRAAAAEAHFRKPGRNDLGLIVSDRPAALAGLFTQNAFKAAPVLVCQEILARHGVARAVLANSGQANACTGDEGMANCRRTQALAAELLGLAPSDILPLSTGVIGAQLPMDRYEAALPVLCSKLGSADAEGFTRAFMTTDAFPKFSSRRLELSLGSVRLTVMAKGAGMICPNMATMLAVALTDAAVERATWQGMFARAVSLTFNRVTVDGDTSTNDTILGLANGASGTSVASEGDRDRLEGELTAILGAVSHMLVMDGEGAGKVMRIAVTGARDDRNAEVVARSIGRSQLVKTAIYGGDANWGRIVTAVGYSGAEFDPAKVRLALCGIDRFVAGQPVNDDQEDRLAELLKAKDVAVDVVLGDGPGTYVLEASDLGHEYVTLNSDYRS
jgi:glutamate N-acetyltransferase/amino-acid N-acetyltransferase